MKRQLERKLIELTLEWVALKSVGNAGAASLKSRIDVVKDTLNTVYEYKD